MGITERRQREKEQRREHIVDAAERVFFSSGWEAATMDAVAADAELGKATLYLYFNSKEALYSAVLLRGMRIMHEMFRQAQEGKGSGIERVEAIGRAYIGFAYQHPDYFNAMMHFGSKSTGPEEIGDCERECDQLGEGTIAMVAGAVQSGIEDGTIRAGLDPLKTAFILWAQTTGMLQVLSVKGEHMEGAHGLARNDLMERFFEFVELALRPS